MDLSQLKQLELHRKFWKIGGAAIFITDPATQHEVGYIKMKAWRLRDDVTIYTSRDMQTALVNIKAQQIITLGATYDVTKTDGGKLFSLRRKALRSLFVRDYWDIMDANGEPMGFIQETSGTLALARRWLEVLPYGDIIGLIFSFVPQTYDVRSGSKDGTSQLLGNIIHRKNPVIVKMRIDTSVAEAPVPPYLALSAASMLSIIDAVKNN